MRWYTNQCVSNEWQTNTDSDYNAVLLSSNKQKIAVCLKTAAPHTALRSICQMFGWCHVLVMHVLMGSCSLIMYCWVSFKYSLFTQLFAAMLRKCSLFYACTPGRHNAVCRKRNSFSVLPLDAGRWQGTSGFQWLSFLSKPLPRCASSENIQSKVALIPNTWREATLFKLAVRLLLCNWT